MMTYSEKIKLHRRQLGMNQQELADKLGVSKRSVAAYETGTAKPRAAVSRRLAEILGVTEGYLTNPAISDPQFGRLEEDYINKGRSGYGAVGAREVTELLRANTALFAGGELSQDAKDEFFEAVMKAYLLCKDEARRTYGRRKNEPEDGHE